MKTRLTPRKILSMIVAGKTMRRKCWPESYLYCILSEETGELMVRKEVEDSAGNVAKIWDRLWVEELFENGWEVIE